MIENALEKDMVEWKGNPKSLEKNGRQRKKNRKIKSDFYKIKENLDAWGECSGNCDTDHKRNKYFQKNKHGTVQLLVCFCIQRYSAKNPSTSPWALIGKKAKAKKLLLGTVVMIIKKASDKMVYYIINMLKL